MLFLATSGPLLLIACSALPCPPCYTLISPLWLGAAFGRTPEITAAMLARFCSSHWWKSRFILQSGRPDSSLGKERLSFSRSWCHYSIFLFCCLFFFFFWSVCRWVPLHENGGWRSEDNFEELLLCFHCMSCQAYIVILVASLAISLAFFVSWKPTMYTISYFAFFFPDNNLHYLCLPEAFLWSSFSFSWWTFESSFG